MTRTRRIAALLLLTLLGNPVWAETAVPLRQDDRLRLDALDDARRQSVAEAEAVGVTIDPGLIALPSGQAGSTGPEAILGQWRCRITKLGKETGMVAYDAFTCRGVRDPQGRVIFEKTGGSQRVRGEVLAETDRLVLLGVGYIAGDTAPAYAELPEILDPMAEPQITTEPGLITFTDPHHARIFFPFPTLESTLDVMDLERTGP